MPLQRIVPKCGFTNNFRKEYTAVNVGTIDLFVEAGKLDSTTISIDDIKKAGLAGKKDSVKLLGDGEINRSIDIEVHKVSKSARKKVRSEERRVGKEERCGVAQATQ